MRLRFARNADLNWTAVQFKNSIKGKGSIPHIDQPEKSQLPIIVLQMIASLNNANQQKDRLIEIASDGDVADDELEEFEAIQAELEKITETVKTLELWAEKAIKKS